MTTKASKSVHPKSESLNRRRVLTGAFTAAASVAGAGISHHAIAAPHVAAPTADGRRLLGLIATLREAYGCLWVDGDPTDATQAVVDDAWAAVYELGREITARPATSMSDVVDRAILAGWSCDPFEGQLKSDGDDCGNFQAAHILAVLSLAGISPAQCNVGLDA